STGYISGIGNSSILSTGYISGSGNSSILSTGATSTTDIANILESKTQPTAGASIKLNTCANVNVTVGSSDASRFASCSDQVKARKVPEPSTIFSLTLLGAFLLFSRHKSFSVKKAEIIRQLKIG
ncbi:MAG: PEP-CTERM sorting domain-containing protein, partial [Rhizonema sp. PD38]|nr:PEP-CTERM sorting domain-containing protein [Rhizonema sp. PD38]